MSRIFFTKVKINFKHYYKYKCPKYTSQNYEVYLGHLT